MPSEGMVAREHAASALLLAASLVLEAGALGKILESEPSWAGFLLLHGLGGIGLAVILFLQLPPAWREPHSGVLALLLSIAWFVPLVGAAALLSGVLVAIHCPGRGKRGRLALLRAPEQAQPTGPREGSYGHGAIRPLLGNSAVPAPRRLKALLALEHVPANRASALLRAVLNDADEDIRLIAHGILDKREKGVQEAIAETLARMDGITDGAARLAGVRRLAQLQWELIYGDLALGDVRAHLVDSTHALVKEALELAPAEPGLWYMKGRLAIERHDWADAEHCFEEGLRCGLPRGRALPWLAEIAFRARRLDRVRACMRELAGLPLESGISSSMRYWCGDEG